jgi:gliding motility-associated lipoprotein GldH
LHHNPQQQKKERQHSLYQTQNVMNLKLKIVSIFVAVMLCSCDDKRLFDDYKTIANGWHKDSIIAFEFDQKNMVGKHNLYVNIRNNNDYKYSNLFLIVSMEHPNGFTKVDTLQYLMASPDGTLLGEGFTDVKENKLFYKQNFKFSKAGKYKIRIQQAVRKTGKIAGDKKLEGISAVGFRLEKAL